MVMLPNQRVRINQKAVRVHWSDIFWVVPVVIRSPAPTFRRLSIPASLRGSVLSEANRFKAISVIKSPVRRSPRGRGELRRELGCPSASWAPLMAFASLPLRCRPIPRLRLQHIFRHPGL
jgi:hypothetical protein